MASFIIRDIRQSSATVLPDDFVDYFMPRANGEFVKIYIYLLRSAHTGDVHPSLSSIADVFSCTEKDVLRALRYWERTGLVQLSFDSGKELTGVQLLPPTTFQETQKIIVPESPTSTEDSAVSEKSTEVSTKPVGRQKAEISSSRAKELSQNEEVRQILFMAEQYIGRPLSATDIRRLLYFYDELHFSADLMDYLVEYCVSKDQRSLSYIEKVGLSWHAEGLNTVKKAKAHTNLYKHSYFAIFKAFGIRNRNPIPNEQADMDRWLIQYGFPLEIIQEAAARTISATGKASFNYAERILADWHSRKITSLDEIQKLDKAFKAERAEKNGTAKQKAAPRGNTAALPSRRNGFHNFEERDASEYDRLQKELLQRQLNDARK